MQRIWYTQQVGKLPKDNGRTFCWCVEGLKISADKSKVMILNGEEGLECEILVDRMRGEMYFG